MDEGIFFVHGNDLVEMRQQQYEGEAILQKLLADHPMLLSGSRHSSSRLLLIQREAGIPDREGASERWSVDHLYLDQDAIPTLVEVKRSSDTRIRREVVGQMLDYAANAVKHWDPDELAARFEATCEANGSDPVVVLDEFVDASTEHEAFWQAAKANLLAGRIRLVFVADVIPRELQRIVEFLNEQMNPAEVIAIEIRQFIGNDLTALVPRVLGQTARAEQIKSVRTTSSGQRWDEERFFAHAAESLTAPEVNTLRVVYDWARSAELVVSWGAGVNTGSAAFAPADFGKGTKLFNLFTNGELNVWKDVARQIAGEARGDSVVSAIESVPGQKQTSLVQSSFVKFTTEGLVSSGGAQQLIAVLDSAIRGI